MLSNSLDESALGKIASKHSRQFFLVGDENGNISNIFPPLNFQELEIEEGASFTHLFRKLLKNDEAEEAGRKLLKRQAFFSSKFRLSKEGESFSAYFETSFEHFYDKSLPIAILHLEKSSPSTGTLNPSHPYSSYFNTREKQLKEIEVLKKASQILFKDRTAYKDALQELTRVIPEMFYKPEAFAAALHYDNSSWYSTPYSNNLSSLRDSFEASGKDGVIEIMLLESERDMEKPFSESERRTLGALSNLVKSYLELLNYEQKLNESYHTYYEIFNNVGTAIFIEDQNGRLIDMNEWAEKMHGYEKPEMLGLKPEKVLLDDDNPMKAEIDDLRKKVLKEKEPKSFQEWIYKKDGGSLLLEVVFKPTNYFGQEAIIATTKDMTEWEATMENLRKKEKLLNKIGQHFPEGSIMVLNQDHTIEYLEGADFRKVYQDLNPTGKNFFEALPVYKQKEEYEDISQKLKRIFKGESISYERHFPSDVYEYKGVPIPDPENGGNLAMIIAHNVTEQRKTHRQLQENIQLLNSITSNIIEGIYRTDSQGKIIYANQACARIFGYAKPDEIKSKDIGSLYENSETSKYFFTQLRKNGKVRNEEVKLKREDGSNFWGLVNISQNIDSSGNILFDGAINDITDRKIFETSFKEEKEFADTIINSLPAIFFMVDEEMRLVNWNKNLELLTGFTINDLHGQNPSFLVNQDPDSSRLLSIFSKLFREETSEFFEIPLATKRGHSMPFYFSASRLTKYGKSLILGIGIDISDQKSLERQLKESLKEKDTLLKEVHHRVKNNLAIIQSLLQMQSYKLPGTSEKFHLLEAQSRIKSIALVHEKLYQTDDSLSCLDLKKYLDEFAINVRDTIVSPDQNIETVLQGQSININVNKGVPLGLLINELLCNAFEHAFSDSKEGRVKIQLEEREQEAKIKIEDNGPGIPDMPGKQNSLGFTLIEGLVQQIDGNISFKNECGTVVTITFKP